MKVAVLVLAAITLLAGCQKNLSIKEESINAETVSNDALTPLPCHSISLITDYTTSRGQQPPFTFTKTLYSDTRVKSIRMLSRATPNHTAFKKQMWETIGTFTYAPNKALFTGTKELFEYFITSTGGSGKKSLGKRQLKLTFEFNERGWVQNVWNELGEYDPNINGYYAVNALAMGYGFQVPQEKIPDHTLFRIYIGSGSDEGRDGTFISYIPKSDQYGNPLEILYNAERYKIPGVAYTYDYTIPRSGRNYSFIPSQNLISFEYNMCEVMQWLPQPTHQRKDVTGMFYLSDGGRVNQKQYYKNYKFDTKGNQVSVTYADNVLQKTSWHCK